MVFALDIQDVLSYKYPIIQSPYLLINWLFSNPPGACKYPPRALRVVVDSPPQFKPLKPDKQAAMKQIKEILFQRLEKSGVDINFIPGFIRSLVNSCRNDPNMNLLQINRRLHYLGWQGIELDYHTLQLAIACLENEGLENMEIKPVRWFESNFSPPNPQEPDHPGELSEAAA